MDSFLRLVTEQHASDLHFSAGHPPTIRHGGDLVPLPFRVLSEAESRRFLWELLLPEERDKLEQRRELDFIYALEGVGRFRVNVFLQARGPSAVFRVIPAQMPTFEQLMLPPALRRFTQMQNGLVLVTGPTGSGKTSTLAAIIHEINANPGRKRHIITIEDPVEHIHRPIHSVITQRQVGSHTESFASALRSAMRESPDILVVGEMRDYETISLALSAAETGVLVLGTLHTRSAAKAVDRMIDAFPDDTREQMRGAISVLLKGVVAQHLVKRADGEGRVAAAEILLPNFAVANMIRENKVHQLEGYLQSVDPGSGMQSLDTALFKLMRQEIVGLEDALRVANDPEGLRARARSLDLEAS